MPVSHSDDYAAPTMSGPFCIMDQSEQIQFTKDAVKKCRISLKRDVDETNCYGGKTMNFWQITVLYATSQINMDDAILKSSGSTFKKIVQKSCHKTPSILTTCYC
eukprot:CAMPEP_0171303198 /NCGR_PEP_ID=MMETSP0816-20121228/12706_1 /TAXON_ID=420281 /ORGANISM="Proboscia inermis, Strain CCAP1064/1" /LENGTH=104 /DNA_ID=CAMNT_0011782277 /DNA_START=1 /DNA_END=315 /DNA_ORIENTATION=+